MNQSSDQNARAYAGKQQLKLAERLGFGVHGIIYAVEGKSKKGRKAIKAHDEAGPYARERDVYVHLKNLLVDRIRGFNVPQLINFDDSRRIIEMSIVTRPFVLDFAGAYLHEAPEFPEETWAAWEAEKREQFEGRWPKVMEILAELAALGVHMVDVTPGNIALLE
jgi:hypothetical protein